MKNIENTEIASDLKDFPENMVIYFSDLIFSKDYTKKHDARLALVKIGESIKPYLYKLLDSKNDSLRMESAKVLELLADKSSIPYLIKLLDDKEFEIRWIAAEGLIKIGRSSITPLLKLVRNGESTYFQNKGVHQVLESLLSKNEKIKLAKLLLVLEDYHELGEIAPYEASMALKSMFKGS